MKAAFGFPDTPGAATTIASSKRNWSGSGSGSRSNGLAPNGEPVSTPHRSSNGSGPQGQDWVGSGKTLSSSAASSVPSSFSVFFSPTRRWCRTPATRPLRHLHGLPRRLSDHGLPRAEGARCPSLHRLSHGRTPVRNFDEFWSSVGTNIAGCDICQEVCPWTQRAPADLHPEFAPATRRLRPRLEDLEGLDEVGYAEWRRGSAVNRIRYEQFRRNLGIARSNIKNADD